MSHLDSGEWAAWVGREQLQEDAAVAGPLRGLAALLDHETSPWRDGELPPLSHWLYFLPHARQSTLDADGHPRRGDFLPPIPLPRRMWVGSRIRFKAPVPLGTPMLRRSIIASISSKAGRTGALVFVSVTHEISVAEQIAIVEEQDIVYRAAASPAATAMGAVPTQVASARGATGAAVAAGAAGAAASLRAPRAARPAQATRRVVTDAIQLFRFSALTFNAHRIHYDRDYAREVEGYPGLVVQGPFVALLLMDHFLRRTPGARVLEFDFRAVRPLFDTTPFDLCLAVDAEKSLIWALDASGSTAFTANVVAASRGAR